MDRRRFLTASAALAAAPTWLSLLAKQASAVEVWEKKLQIPPDSAWLQITPPSSSADPDQAVRAKVIEILKAIDRAYTGLEDIPTISAIHGGLVHRLNAVFPETQIKKFELWGFFEGTGSGGPPPKSPDNLMFFMGIRWRSFDNGARKNPRLKMVGLEPKRVPKRADGSPGKTKNERDPYFEWAAYQICKQLHVRIQNEAASVMIPGTEPQVGQPVSQEWHDLHRLVDQARENNGKELNRLTLSIRETMLHDHARDNTRHWVITTNQR